MNKTLLLLLFLLVRVHGEVIHPPQSNGDIIVSFLNQSDLIVIPDSINIGEPIQRPAYSDSQINVISVNSGLSKGRLQSLLSQTIHHKYAVTIIPKGLYPNLGFKRFELEYDWIEGNQIQGQEIIRGIAQQVDHISNAAAISMFHGYGINHPDWKYLWSANPKCVEAIRSLANKCASEKKCKESSGIQKYCQAIKIGTSN